MTPSQLLPRCTFPDPGTAVRCGVSGGPDSTALALLAHASDLRCTLVHVDHGLRPSSGDEAEWVRELARDIDARFELHTLPVGEGPNLEARARAARLGALGPGALVGHTADDQAETLLLALLRGTGPAGLAGADPTVRPLLRLRRTETAGLCAAAGYAPIQDPSNHDPRHRRNRVRHELLPLLEAIAERDVVPLLCRTAEIMSETVAGLDAVAATVDASRARDLAAQPDAVAAAALRRWWRTDPRREYPPDRAAIRRMLAVARGEAVACEISGGWRMTRSRGRLQVSRGR